MDSRETSLRSRWWLSWLSLVWVVLAASGSWLAGAGGAGAAPVPGSFATSPAASTTYDAAPYAYGSMVTLSATNSVTSSCRVPPSGAIVASWGQFVRSSGAGVAAETGGIAANAAAGNAARDAIAAEYPGSSIEQTFSTTLGARRVDVLTQDGLAIESKVGRTSLTSGIQSQIAKDQLLLQNGDVNGVQWVFGRSGVTGQIGPTGPLQAALDKAGIGWTLGP